MNLMAPLDQMAHRLGLDPVLHRAANGRPRPRLLLAAGLVSLGLWILIGWGVVALIGWLSGS